ncbi:hypothetical protein [Engelhardtia mirabilis]|uniref:Nickel uptake substrate-specific transmembrane region n=1 Tax=Engelhardtia mirabilis TaxID=2528011 RepID=A0A518BE78_9BACT|nr:hypothetical protein Pla133_03360 [Planctomycetes bacterium Pla133]QDU99598.1 hypothetical protein Pla86_03360 [Planctomycetes bacterium Pla86]
MRAFCATLFALIALVAVVWLASTANEGSHAGHGVAFELNGAPDAESTSGPALDAAAHGAQDPTSIAAGSEPQADGQLRRPIASDPVGAGLRVVDEDGAPIDGATVRFTPWHPQHWALGTGAALPATADLESATELRTTDEGGSCDAPSGNPIYGSAYFGSVVWAARPGSRVAGRTAPYQDSSPLFDGELTLERAPPAVATVVDGGLQPVPDARIEVRLPAITTLGTADRPRLVHARSMFHWLGQSGPTGDCELPAAPLDDSGLPDLVLVRAVHGGSLSGWTAVRPGDQVTLTLEAAFELQGLAPGSQDWLGEYATPPAVVVDCDTGAGWERLTTCALRPDTSFGPFQVPFREGAAYRVWLDGDTCEPAEARLTNVRPGTQRSITLEATLGWPLWIQVLARATGEALLDGDVSFEWRGAGGRMERRAWLDELDGSRLHVARGLPESVPLTVTVHAAGYAAATLDGLELPASASQVHQLSLDSAAPLHGRVTGLDPLPAAIDLLVGRHDARPAVRHRVELRPDGTFDAAEAPVGELWCAAVTPAGGRSTIANVGEVRFADLAFADRMALAGTVVDRETGVPIDEAWVVPALLVGERSVPAGRAAPVDATGRFRIDFGPTSTDGVAVLVEAPGYSSATRVVASSAAPFDLGQVRLAPAIGAVLVFESELGRSIPRASFRADGPSVVEQRLLDDTGRVELGDVALGSYQATLEVPGEDLARGISFDVRRDDDQIRVPLDGPGSIGVALPSAGTSSGRWRCELSAATSRFGLILQRHVAASATAVEFTGLPLLDWRVDLVDEDSGSIVDSTAAPLSEAAPHADVSLSASAAAFWIRVVDASGAPVAGARVVGRDALATSAWFQAQTDVNGLAVYRAEVPDDLVLDVVGPAGGSALATPAGPDARALHTASEDPFVVPLQSNCTAAVRLTGVDGEPLEGIEVQFFTETRTDRLGPPVQSDLDGLARLEGVGAGRTHIVVEDARFVPALWRATAAPEPEVAQLTLYRRSPLTVRVLDAELEPVPAATISTRFEPFGTHALEAFDWYGMHSSPEGYVTGADGICAISGVPEGELRLTVTAGAAVAEFDVQARPGETGAIDLVVQGD